MRMVISYRGSEHGVFRYNGVISTKLSSAITLNSSSVLGRSGSRMSRIASKMSMASSDVSADDASDDGRSVIGVGF